MAKLNFKSFWHKTAAFLSVLAILIFSVTSINAKKLDFYGNNLSDWATFTFPTAGGQIRWRILVNENPTPPGPGQARIIDVPWGQTATEFIPAFGDYTGDGINDFNLYRDETGTPANSYIILPISPNQAPPGAPIYFQWGNALTDIIGTEGDYDGDGAMDPTIVRAPTATSAFEWWIFRTGTMTVQPPFIFGTNATDIALAGADYTGDGMDDPAVARIGAGGQITWHVGTVNGTQINQTAWGDFDTDFIVPGGDYDGDNRADYMVWRAFGAGTNGVWYLRTSSGNISYTTFGIPGASGTRDVALRSGDYDGDNITDIAVYRPSTRTFWVARSSGGFQSQQWGEAGLTNLPIASFGIF